RDETLLDLKRKPSHAGSEALQSRGAVCSRCQPFGNGHKTLLEVRLKPCHARSEIPQDRSAILLSEALREAHNFLLKGGRKRRHFLCECRKSPNALLGFVDAVGEDEQALLQVGAKSC
ncbi:hypothetical protein NKH71_33125, partial [Mesorhizobium sp. M0983]|uniref:hypothetical protein n=1 Tax=Mesorhizobium sp. M0983 TaxID=2957040 RepID=UPI00333C8CBF